MRIVVTGSSGKLGSAVVIELMAAGHEVTRIDMRPGCDIAGAPPTHVIDSRDVDALIPLFRGAHAVCHLGNLPSINKFPLTNGFINNVGTNHAVFEAALGNGVRKIIYASSVMAYGVIPNSRQPRIPFSTPRYLPIDEDHPLLPADAYPLSKAMGEWTAESFCRQEPQLEVFSLRFTLITKEAPDPRKAQESTTPHHHVGGSMFTWIHVEDAARACRLACEAQRRGHTPLNIVAPQSFVAWEHDWIREFYGTLPEFHRTLGPRDPLITSERAKEILGFEADPLRSLDPQESFLKAAPL